MIYINDNISNMYTYTPDLDLFDCPEWKYLHDARTTPITYSSDPL